MYAGFAFRIQLLSRYRQLLNLFRIRGHARNAWLCGALRPALTVQHPAQKQCKHTASRQKQRDDCNQKSLFPLHRHGLDLPDMLAARL